MIFTITMCSLDFDEAYIDHFLSYYKNQGVDHYILILHSKNPVHEEPYKDHYSTLNVSVSFLYGAWNTKIKEDCCLSVLEKMNLTEEDWIIYADIDEHAEARGKTLKEKIGEMALDGENCCLGKMIDRVAKDGGLPMIEPLKPLSEQFPLVKHLTSRVLRGSTKKIPIAKANLRLKGGHHDLMEESEKDAVFNSEILSVHHYKWGQNVKEKLEERVETHKEFYHWRESDRFLKFWETTGKIQ